MAGWISSIIVCSCVVFVKGTTTNNDTETENCEFTYLSTQAKNGTFTSPGYPHPYPADRTCHYIFQGQGRERVQIIFSDLDLNYPGGNPADPYDCDEMDSVTISINAEGTQRDIGTYCGSKRPLMHMSNSNNLDVAFISGVASDKKGFRAQYNFLTNFGIYAGRQKTDGVCRFIFNSDGTSNGTFTSPNFPGIYPRNTECHYLFYGRDDEKVHITFPYFDVEGIPPGCNESTESDYVEFSNFKAPDRRMNRVCGSGSTPQSQTSEGSFFHVTFKSNVIYDATGFEAFYQFRRDPNGNSGQRIDPTSGGHLVPTILLQILTLLTWTWTS